MKIHRPPDRVELTWEETHQAMKDYIEKLTGRKISGEVWFSSTDIGCGKGYKTNVSATLEDEDIKQ